MGRYTAFYGIFLVGYLFGGISLILAQEHWRRKHDEPG